MTPGELYVEFALIDFFADRGVPEAGLAR